MSLESLPIVAPSINAGQTVARNKPQWNYGVNGSHTMDLSGYLFGDVLLIRMQDLYWLAGAAVLILTVLRMLWKSLLPTLDRR